MGRPSAVASISHPPWLRQVRVLAALAATHRGGGPAFYRAVLEAIAPDIDATYCRLVLARSGWLTIAASAGVRPPEAAGSVPLDTLPQQARSAIEEHRVVTISGDGSESASPDTRWLFSRRTRLGLIVPFGLGAAEPGALIVGEERATRRQPLTPERLEHLQFVAQLLGEITEHEQAARARRRADRRRERRHFQKTERARLSRDVHDSVGQSLNALLLRIRLALARGEVGVADLKLLELSAQEALDTAQALAYRARRPSTNALRDVHASLQAVARDAGTTLRWSDRRRQRMLPRRTDEALAAAIRESVINACRHAKAETITVTIEEAGPSILATIRDDGAGFIPETVGLSPDGRGLGLLGMRERLEAIGGYVDLQSTPGSGTTVALEAPAAKRAAS